MGPAAPGSPGRPGMPGGPAVPGHALSHLGGSEQNYSHVHACMHACSNNNTMHLLTLQTSPIILLLPHLCCVYLTPIHNLQS